jgi:hypothetical protein
VGKPAQGSINGADRRPLSAGYPTALDGTDGGRALVGFVDQDPLKLTMGLDTDQLTVAWFRWTDRQGGWCTSGAEPGAAEPGISRMARQPPDAPSHFCTHPLKSSQASFPLLA